MGRLIFPLALLASSCAFAQTIDVQKQISDLTALVQKLQARVDDLEAKLTPVGQTVSPAQDIAQAKTPAPQTDPLGGTTVNFLFDGYYGWNFNNPIGRVNLLRAYDVSSNAFSLNQAALVVENAPDVEHGKRWGMRLDLQFGQATATLQGNPVNEPRPDIYRNIFQAYGTYVVPVGHGLTVDFGKWSSSLGFENNYTQDQINYSRSLWFGFLPFYHMGVRANYQLTPEVGLNYWVVNGTGWTEAFNGFKDQFFGLTLQPRKSVSWSVNYYLGQEHPDVVFLPGSTIAGLPEQQGVPFAPVAHPGNGKLHILDSYASWQASPKLTLAAEADYVVSRVNSNSAPMRVEGGAGYARYQLTPRFAIAGRGEYLSDHGGFYTGVSQSLREATITFEQKLAPNLTMREEWRRDFSNYPFFLTDTLGILKREQNTATMGVVWWFGSKKSPW
jgi:hypothetical protein